jgi:uncharacterized repeat protein (TIGR03803 family)
MKPLFVGAVAVLATLPLRSAVCLPEQTILYSFSGGADGGAPESTLLADAAGNLYGVASDGGLANNGVVFMLTPPAKHKTTWTETVLHSFGVSPDGALPFAGLVADGQGNLYGTTEDGGSAGLGAVYEVSPPAAGHTTWTEQIIHNFTGAPGDGAQPQSVLLIDKTGNLYGTTTHGGTINGGNGTVFELSPPSGGQTGWTETILYSFGHGPDGNVPLAGVIEDGSGNLYGTTQGGGTCNCGVVFELSPPAGQQGSWTENILYDFQGGNKDGLGPVAGVIFDSLGNLYGTTAEGGSTSNAGTVFKLTPPSGGVGQWTETILYKFTNGGEPFGLVMNQATDLFGTTYLGDSLYELKPPAVGKTTWKEKPLTEFRNGLPSGGVILDTHGNLYGNYDCGGPDVYGCVYRFGK